jgi:hypothetical protein
MYSFVLDEQSRKHQLNLKPLQEMGRRSQGKRRGKGQPAQATRSSKPATAGRRITGILASLGVVGAVLTYALGQATPDLRLVDTEDDIEFRMHPDPTSPVRPDTIIQETDATIRVKNRSIAGGDFVNDVQFIPHDFAAIRAELVDIDRSPIGRLASRRVRFRIRVRVVPEEVLCTATNEWYRYSLKFRTGSGATLRGPDGEPASIQMRTRIEIEYKDSTGAVSSNCPTPQPPAH